MEEVVFYYFVFAKLKAEAIYNEKVTQSSYHQCKSYSIIQTETTVLEQNMNSLH